MVVYPPGIYVTNPLGDRRVTVTRVTDPPVTRVTDLRKILRIQNPQEDVGGGLFTKSGFPVGVTVTRYTVRPKQTDLVP